MKAGHQYNHIERILQGLNELFLLWQSPQTKYKALWGLQEYVRLTTSIRRQATEAINDEAMARAADTILPALIAEVETLIGNETRISMPSLGGQWPKTRRALDLEPPALNQGYYLIGLLDCAAQLAVYIDIAVYRREFVPKLQDIFRTSSVAEYRWKSVCRFQFSPCR